MSYRKKCHEMYDSKCYQCVNALGLLLFFLKISGREKNPTSDPLRTYMFLVRLNHLWNKYGKS